MSKPASSLAMNSFGFLALSSALWVAAAFATTASARADEIMLNMGSAVPMTSTIKGYEKTGKCTTFGFGLSRDLAPGSGLPDVRPQFSAINLTRVLDAASPKLWLAAIMGSAIPTVKITTLNSMGQKVLEIELSDVLVSSYQVSGSTGGNSAFESFALTFSKMKYTVTPYDAKGVAKPVVTTEYDIGAAQAF